MTRKAIAELMALWHSGQSDPVYAVESFFYVGRAYPDKEVFTDAIEAVENILDQQCRMQAGEKVSYTTKYGVFVEDGRAFAGWSDSELVENIGELETILKGLGEYLEKDYEQS